MSKKIVVIVVLVECILAVLLISFFGQEIYNAKNNVKTTEIYFTNEEGERLQDNAVIEVELSDSALSYQLHWVAKPKNISNKKVVFVSDNEDVVVDSYGLVTFFEESTVLITVKSADGSNKTATIILTPKRNTEGDVDI